MERSIDYMYGVFTSILCALSLSLALGSFIHMYCGTGTLDLGGAVLHGR